MERFPQNTVLENISFLKECVIILLKAESCLNFVDLKQFPAISSHPCMWEQEARKPAECQAEVEGDLVLDKETVLKRRLGPVTVRSL